MFKMQLNIDIDVNYVFTWLFILIAVISVLFIFFDINQLIVHTLIWCWCKLQPERKVPVEIDDESEFYSICFVSDIDVYLHMNNARYLRELNYARFFCLNSNGLYNFISKHNSILLQTACNIQYRREIPLFTLFKIVTKIIYWDEKHLYLEHKFITLRDGTVATVCTSRSTVVGNANIADGMRKIMKRENVEPVLPPELQDWIVLMKKNDNRLK